MRKEKIAMSRFLLLQLLVATILSAVVWFIWNGKASLSVLCGGLLVVIPNFVLAIYLFIRVNSIYVGEALKIMLTGLLLVLLLHFVDVALAPLLLGLLGTYSVYFFSRCLYGS